MSMTPEALLEFARATIDAAQFCFLISQDDGGQSTARLMQPFGTGPDLTLWLGTSPTSRKVRAIERDPRVTLAFAHPAEGAYVTLSGSARLEDDESLRQHNWRPEFAAFWPTGPTGDDYILIQVAPTRVELMYLAQEVSGLPYGLRPVILECTETGWVRRD